MKYFDQHVHCNYSKDSQETIENYILRAIELGLDALVLTDHIDLDPEQIDEWVADIDEETKELERLKKKFPQIKLLQGVEIGYDEENLDYIKNLVSSHPNLDVVNFSMHCSAGVNFYYIERFTHLGIDNTLKLYFDAIIEMISTFHDYDVLSHIDYAFATAKMNGYQISIKDYETFLIKIMEILVKENKALEINTKVQSKINDDDHLLYLLRLYKSLGGKYVTLSSDAHEQNKLFDNFDKYFRLIKMSGLNNLTIYISRKPVYIPIK